MACGTVCSFAGIQFGKLVLSPFQECLLDGSFDEKGCRSGVVPLKIADEEFNKMFLLVDGIYMNYACFVMGIKLSASIKETKYTQWQ